MTFAGLVIEFVDPVVADETGRHQRLAGLGDELLGAVLG
jgi:hypothetical protein